MKKISAQTRFNQARREELLTDKTRQHLVTRFENQKKRENRAAAEATPLETPYTAELRVRIAICTALSLLLRNFSNKLPWVKAIIIFCTISEIFLDFRFQSSLLKYNCKFL